MKGGHAEVVKFLLSQGAKVSAYLDMYMQQYNAIELILQWFSSMCVISNDLY